MSEFIKIKDSKFDKEKYKEVVETIENYAVGSILTGKNVVCSVDPTSDICSTLRYRRSDSGISTIVEVKFPINKDSWNYKFIIRFQDNKFDPSGFKGVFAKEKYKYRLQRSGNYFDYEITTNIDNHVEQVKRLMKLFRKYL
jgi:hypothetical protein